MKGLFKATLIVTIFSVLTRAMGFVLRIILSRVLGAEILGYYQVAMSVFGVLLTLVASGLPLVVSRTVAYKKQVQDDRGAHASVTAGLIVTLAISIIVSAVLYIFPNILTKIFNNNITTGIVLYSLPAIIASAIYCVLRSALWGERRFFAMSFTEFFEQVVRIILCFILFAPGVMPWLSLGEKASLSLSISCVMSCLLVIIIYFALKDRLANPRGTFKSLLKSSTPITVVRSASSVVTSLIALIIPARLMLYGFTESQAMAEFGMVMGMAFPLIMIPGTLISSLAVALVPEISSKTSNIDDKSSTRDFDGLKSHVNLAINVSLAISMIFVPAFFVLGTPICEILFGSSGAGAYVSRAAIIMIPMGISQITSSLLNSMGLEMKSLINYVISAIALFLCIFFLPKYLGTNALIVGMGSLSTISAVLNLRMLKKRNLFAKGFGKFFIKVLGYGVVSGVAGTLLLKLLKLFLPKFIYTVIVGIVCVMIMFLFYFMFDVAHIRGFVLRRARKNKQKAVQTSNEKSAI